MPNDHARKNRARKRQQRAPGAAYVSANAGTAHQHPAPDLAILADSPYAAGRPVNLPLAVAAVAACRAGCQPCQASVIPRLLADRVTIAALAGAVYGLLPVPGSFASPATRTWQPLARQANDSGDGAEALAALDRMPAEEVADLLDDARDHWAAGGADISPFLLDLEAADDTESEPGAGAAGGPPSYALFPGMVNTSHGGPLPIVILEPQAPDAGADDLRSRCGWPRWDLTVIPEPDPAWRLRLNVAAQSVEAIAHVDHEGWDDIVLWEASEATTLPDDWWHLIDRTQHVLLCGPATAVSTHATPADALTAAVGAGPLMAVVARVRFL
ncbi:hypothetical protein ACQPYK_50155 (plasmid) [Streptosporangium sp. CA-135522]|uniref:hypothetical protein n=1 Tax=Streptosporangium sp. CA-135522 TaxID=3240072 RepID=UPI003D91B4F2